MFFISRCRTQMQQEVDLHNNYEEDAPLRCRIYRKGDAKCLKYIFSSISFTANDSHDCVQIHIFLLACYAMELFKCKIIRSSFPSVMNGPNKNLLTVNHPDWDLIDCWNENLWCPILGNKRMTKMSTQFSWNRRFVLKLHCTQGK
jgi:hypothetical protein